MIWSKIKFVIGAIVVALFPLLYVFGVKAGRNDSEVDELRRAAKANRDSAEFHRKLDELNDTLDTPRNRTELVDRLRDEGL